MIDLDMYLNSSFVYRDNGIRFGFIDRNSLCVYMFQDQTLMAGKASTFMRLI